MSFNVPTFTKGGGLAKGRVQYELHSLLKGSIPVVMLRVTEECIISYLLTWGWRDSMNHAVGAGRGRNPNPGCISMVGAAIKALTRLC